MEDYTNEVAIIFIAKKGVNGNEIELIPQEITDGFYDFFNERFIDLKGKEYSHFINIEVEDDLYPCFGFNYNLKEYFVKFPECSYNTIFNTILEKLKKYTFVCKIQNVLTNIEVFNIETGKVSYITDNLCDELNNIAFRVIDAKEDNLSQNSNVNVARQRIIQQDNKVKEEKIKIDTKGLYKKLKDYIIGQDKPLETIVGTIWKNYNSEGSATNILIAGPTGVGKTETARIISSYINVPIVTVGANDFSQVGYVGDNTKDILKNLLSAADGNIELAERGIVVLDELDKIAAKSGDRNNVATRAVQYELLKLIEDGSYYIDGKKLCTKNITFLACGAFQGINTSNSKHLGFNKDIFTNETKNYTNITFDDIERYGLSRQLLGRLPLLVFYSALTVDDFYHIMKDAKGSELLKFIEVFEKYDKELIFEDDAVVEIAKLAKELNLGARSISTIINNVMQCINFDMSQDLIVKSKIIVTPETVLNPKKYILR